MKAIAGLAIGFLLVGVGATAASATTTQVDPPETDTPQVCTGLSTGKQDVSGSKKEITYTAPDGQLIVGYCVKAGSENQDDGGPEYFDISPGVESITFGHSSGKDVSHWSVKLGPAPEDNPNYCNPAEKPAGMSIADWLREGEFNGADCFTVTPNLQCGSFDSTVDGPYAGYTWKYLEGAGKAPNLSTGMALPATFGEDYKDGSVQITVWLEGPEKDYLVGTGLPNYWDGNGRTVTIDTDCAPPGPEVVAPAFPGPIAPQCDADGSLPTLPAETDSITYTWDESNSNMMIATAKSNFVFADSKTEVSYTYPEPGSATGYQSTDEEEPCYVETPEPLTGAFSETLGQCNVPLDGKYTTVTTRTPWTQEHVLNTKTGKFTLGDKVTGKAVVTKSTKADAKGCSIEVTAVAASVADPPICGPNNDVVNIPTTIGVNYSDTGWVDGQRTITATAKEGFTLVGDTEWTYTDEATLCPVTTEAPTVVAICLPNNDTVTIPEVDGVIYADTGWVGGERTITAAAAEGYALTEWSATSWTFTDVPVAACPDEIGFSYTPTGELAYTGVSTNTNGLAALAIFLMASGTALVGLKVRAQR